MTDSAHYFPVPLLYDAIVSINFGRLATPELMPPKNVENRGETALVLRSASIKQSAFTTHISGSSTNPNVPHASYELASYELFITDGALAERLQKALTHAITLCGGASKEPF
jgi:hypothetical protein